MNSTEQPAVGAPVEPSVRPLVDRLRDGTYYGQHALMNEAADEIEKLRAEVFVLRDANERLVAVCNGIKAALQDERDRWQSAVMLELDSNGQAHAIVAAALGPNV